MVETNIYIFKENIKILLGSIVEQLWTKNTYKDNLDQIIIKEMNKGPIDEIKEVDDENNNTDSVCYSATNLVR